MIESEIAKLENAAPAAFELLLVAELGESLLVAARQRSPVVLRSSAVLLASDAERS